MASSTSIEFGSFFFLAKVGDVLENALEANGLAALSDFYQRNGGLCTYRGRYAGHCSRAG